MLMLLYVPVVSAVYLYASSFALLSVCLANKLCAVTSAVNEHNVDKLLMPVSLHQSHVYRVHVGTDAQLTNT